MSGNPVVHDTTKRYAGCCGRVVCGRRHLRVVANTGFVGAVCVALLCAPCVYALDDVASVGGTYRYGHVSWNAMGSTVKFTIEAAFKRDISDVSTWSGTAQDNLTKVGDTVKFPGRQPPRFYFGDGTVERAMTMTVTALSVAENWVMGTCTTVHEYSTPNNKGQPWYAHFTGCCRHSRLVNNKDAEWVITAAVDLNLADKSPKANVLPVVSVPFRKEKGKPTKPWLYVPAEDNADGKVKFRVGKPWDIGNSAVFRSIDESFIAVPLHDMSQEKCTAASDIGGDNFAGPGCLFRALRTDAGQKAMTVEGWVQAARGSGGYVLSVGADNGKAKSGYAGPDPRPDCSGAPHELLNKEICTVASLLIRVNATHIVVGHEVLKDSIVSMQEEPFEICSSAYLESGYLCQQTDPRTGLPVGNATNKWMHVAVVRFLHVVPGGSDTSNRALQVSYKVLVNGRPLMVSVYPGGPSSQRRGEAACGPDDAVACAKCDLGCASGEYCDASDNNAGLCKSCEECPPGQFRVDCRGSSAGACKFEADAGGGGRPFENGESNPVQGPVPPLFANATTSKFATGAALIFGAYKGASKDAVYFDGALDEWRLWNGARSDSAILNGMKKPLTIKNEPFHGDPSDATRRVSQQNYLVSSVLMASWSFDQDCPMVRSTGCELKDVESVYPKDQDPRVPYPPGKTMYTAYTYKIKTGETDSEGRMFHSMSEGMTIDQRGKLTLHTNVIGEHQVVVLMSYEGATVPVDFVVKVLPAECSAGSDGNDATQHRCELCAMGTMNELPGHVCAFKSAPDNSVVAVVQNQFMPSLTLRAGVLEDPTSRGNGLYTGSAKLTTLQQHLYPSEIRMYAGFQLEVQLEGVDPEGLNSGADGEVYDDVYTRVGFTLGRMPQTLALSTITGTNPAQLKLSWTPCAADLGLHTLCFEAIDAHRLPGNTPGLAMAPSASSEQKCMQIRVEQEEAPHFVLGAQATPDQQQMCTMGLVTKINVKIASANCQARMEVVAAAKALPEGAVLSYVDAPSPSEGSLSATVCRQAEFVIKWTPGYTQGGLKEDVCLEARSVQNNTCNQIAPKSSKHCIPVFVQRCRYTMEFDQQLQEIAALYDVDWMRMWSLNAALLHPDYVLYGGQTVMVGHLYKALAREIPLAVAKRMGMTTEQLRKLNYGLDLEMELLQGQELCVVPNSCAGSPSRKYANLAKSSLPFFIGSTAAVPADSSA